MSALPEGYEILETYDDENGVRRRVKRLSDGGVFDWLEIDYKQMDDALKEVLISEINTLKKVSHPNIVHHEDVIVKKDTSTVFLITELAQQQSLQALIDSQKKKNELIDEFIIWSVLTQLCEGLHALTQIEDPHRKQLVHRCLKPACIAFDAKSQKVKIGKFGFGLVSTPYYATPEFQSLGLCSEKSDIWALGCIIYELTTLRRPFKDFEKESKVIVDWKTSHIPKVYSRDLNSIIRFILTPDEDTRPSALMILHHPILESKRQSLKMDSSEKVLETDFPVVAKDHSDNSLEVSAISCSEFSLNQYLSMLSDHDNSTVFIDDVDIRSIENGTAHPKATSSVLHASPVHSLKRNTLSRLSEASTEYSLSVKASELWQKEAYLQRWAKILEEKEQELAHKEKRLQLLEAQLLEMQHLGGGMRQSTLKRNSVLPSFPSTESSGVDTDTESTTSLNPYESFVELPVLQNASKPVNVSSNTNSGRGRLHTSDPSVHVLGESSKQNTEEKLEWFDLPQKKQTGLHYLPTPHKLETDYVVMEEKSILTALQRRRSSRSPGSLRLKPVSSKENAKDGLFKYPTLPCRSSTMRVSSNESRTLTNELRAKLKAHNLPGLR